jgi:hypothetical protein
MQHARHALCSAYHLQRWYGGHHAPPGTSSSAYPSGWSDGGVARHTRPPPHAVWRDHPHQGCQLPHEQHPASGRCGRQACQARTCDAGGVQPWKCCQAVAYQPAPLTFRTRSKQSVHRVLHTACHSHSIHTHTAFSYSQALTLLCSSTA